MTRMTPDLFVRIVALQNRAEACALRIEAEGIDTNNPVFVVSRTTSISGSVDGRVYTTSTFDDLEGFIKGYSTATYDIHGDSYE